MTARFLTFAATLLVPAFAGLRFIATRRQRVAAGLRIDGTDPDGVSAERGAQIRPSIRIDASSDPNQVSALTKTQAEELLDWLESHGVRERRLSYIPGEGFRVGFK